MRVIAPRTAGCVLLIALAVAASATADPPPQSVIDLFATMASALSEGNSQAFLKPIDRAMPGYEKLAANIVALAAQADVQSSIDFLTDEGDEQTRTLELDWFLEIRSRQDSGPLERRRERVKFKLERNKKSWKVESIEPLSFFRAPGAEPEP